MFLALVGMPGSGKSTVGRYLARRLGLPFTDSDHVIEQRIGCSIRDFFAREGEVAFRDLEASVIADLASGAGGVVATGGGTVLREENRRKLREAGSVIYLRSTPEAVWNRVRHDNKRPLLQVEDPMAKIREMHAIRDPLYAQTAHFIIDTGRPTVPALVSKIMMQLELAGLVPPGP
ncbi:MAG: shikimate kinase [Ramlibacter sp.]|nr:shikimate kinase [Ramlibacter sp.]